MPIPVYTSLFLKHFLYRKKIIFQIDNENFSAKFRVALKIGILQVIKSQKHVGTEKLPVLYSTSAESASMIQSRM